MTDSRSIWVPGLLQVGSGIRVLQDELYRRIGADPAFHLTLGPDRGRGFGVGSISERVQSGFALTRQLIDNPRSLDAAILLAPPRPLLLPAQVVLIVCDLRWLRTRTGAGYMYRSMELRHAAAHADAIFAISQATSNELCAFLPSCAGRTRTLQLGPGIVRDIESRFKESKGRLLLIGGAPHKRNELAVAALTEQCPAWLTHITSVGVSSECRALLSNVPARVSQSHYDRLSNENLRSVYSDVDTLLNLSVNEGFGLPYIEALAAGCQVIAIDQPLTREIMNAAAHLIADGDASAVARQIQECPFGDATARVEALSVCSWDTTANAVIEAVGRSS